MENLKQNAMMEEAIASAEISMNIPDTEKCKHNVVGKYCFRCKRPDLACGCDCLNFYKIECDCPCHSQVEIEQNQETGEVLTANGVSLTPDTELKEWFEANYLDGDKVQEGQMLASSECLDALSSRDSYWKERVRKNVGVYANQQFMEGTVVDPLELYNTIIGEDNLK